MYRIIWNGITIDYTHHTTKLLGGILVSLHLSIRPSVRPTSCVCSVASSGGEGSQNAGVQVVLVSSVVFHCSESSCWTKHWPPFLFHYVIMGQQGRLTIYMLIVFQKMYEYRCTFCMISEHLGGASNWNNSLGKTSGSLCYIIERHGWWPGTTRSQVISKHGIHLILPKYFSSSTRRFNVLIH